MSASRYISAAKWNQERYYDGDSFDVTFDPGFGLRLVETEQVRWRVRLANCDTPELRGTTYQAGMDARIFTAEWLREAKEHSPHEFYLQIETYETDNFGRWLSDVVRLSDGRNLTEDLIAAGHDTGRRWR